MWLRVDGVEYLDASPTPIATDIYFASTLGPVGEQLTLESLEYRGITLAQRIVGDGISVWANNPVRNEYSASAYGVYNGSQPTTYRSNLLSSFESSLKGMSAYGGRLLREIYGVGGAMYRDWLPAIPDWNRPGESWPKVFENGGSYRDPIFNRLFVSVASQKDYIVYEAARPTRRAIIFERTWMTRPNGTTGWLLTKVYILEHNRLANRDRFVDAALSAYPNMVPTSADFTFQPAPGSRAIAGPKPAGGN